MKITKGIVLLLASALLLMQSIPADSWQTYGNKSGGSTGFSGDLSSVTTDNITESPSHLYWTPVRFNSAFSAMNTDNLTEGASNLYWTLARFNNAFSGMTTDNLTQGVANVYYSDTLSRLALSTTTPLIYDNSTGVISIAGLSSSPISGQLMIGNDDGTFTLARLTAGDNISITNANGSVTIASTGGGGGTWGDITGTLASQTDLQNAMNAKEPSIAASTAGTWFNGMKNFYALYSDNVTEGAKQFFTPERARAVINPGWGILYDNATGVVTAVQQDSPMGNTRLFVDNSTYKHTIVANGDVHQTGAQSVFAGKKSAYFDGIVTIAADTLDIPSPTHLNVGTGDFSFSFRAYDLPSMAVDGEVFWGNAEAAGGWDVYFDNQTYCIASSDAPFWTSCISLAGAPANAWSHLAITRASGTLRMFLNGVSKTITNTNGSFGNADMAATGNMRIGAWSNDEHPLTGYIDELEFTAWARWTSDFTMPTIPQLTDSSTRLLLHMDGDYMIMANSPLSFNPTTGQLAIDTSGFQPTIPA
ncbi:MAG: LamG domain-containing protein, partial [Nitrospirae bacterium]|nr:LamG domain-containing protein [Nitrospirota bacterium]